LTNHEVFDNQRTKRLTELLRHYFAGSSTTASWGSAIECEMGAAGCSPRLAFGLSVVRQHVGGTMQDPPFLFWENKKMSRLKDWLQGREELASILATHLRSRGVSIAVEIEGCDYRDALDLPNFFVVHLVKDGKGVSRRALEQFSVFIWRGLDS
jgi:hypothetical protein